MLCEAMDFIGFPKEQREALEQSERRVRTDTELAARFASDCAALADPEGPQVLEPCEDPLYPALVLLSRFDGLRGEYRARGIGESVLKDTLSDIPLWIEHCRRVFGYLGLREYSWLTLYTRMKLFRLGRLEFAAGRSEVPAAVYRRADGSLTADSAGGEPVLLPGMPVIEVHIPEGPPMIGAEIDRSLAAAPVFFSKKMGMNGFRAFVCESWLMNPCFAELIPGSNLDGFQRRFFKIPFTDDDAQMFERLYDCRDGKHPGAFGDLPMDTRLRRAMRDHYEHGGRCARMWGVIPIEPGLGIRAFNGHMLPN